MRTAILMQALGIHPPRVVQCEEAGSYILLVGSWLTSSVLLMLDRRTLNTFTHPDADAEEAEDDEYCYQPVANATPSYPHQSTCDNSNATASPFIDTNRLSIAPHASRPLSPLSTLSQAPTAHQHIPLHPQLPQPPQRAPATLSQDQVWTLMAHSRCPKWVWRCIDNVRTPSVGSGNSLGEQDDAVADAYAAVRASLAMSPAAPPTYELYTGCG
ncbi:hypothetical protein K503DRAFT_312050 [Rhizopogon vinicolor AM-OR11-026]|uniref:Uncharacterized protein n=1 Tax=Rhizopogon vinicolor AM-OR11-026 TaxID=1314800 RepID=A0A1B7MUP0_9AGAM|nr:hypothetical protein K503DRAFT_312050 [Rhizopogon vinicolor AM-OR11-026]